MNKKNDNGNPYHLEDWQVGVRRRRPGMFSEEVNDPFKMGLRAGRETIRKHKNDLIAKPDKKEAS
ncbi:hypothetical protein ACFL2Q_12620 [Thermodesulfobacteriota bacterium]